jgi:hypothetical protein
MPDPLFSHLYRDTEHLTWASAEQVQERGRQRTRRTRIAAALASAVAVAVVATGAVAVAGRPDAAPPIPPATSTPTPSGTPDATASPSPTSGSPSPSTGATTPGPAPTSARTGTGPATGSEVPSSAMLQLADLPNGFEAKQSDLDGDWSLNATTIYCDYASPVRSVDHVSERGVEFTSPTDGLLQQVRRYAGDDAGREMNRVRRVVGECEPVRQGDSLSILADDLGGDDSLLVGALIEGRPNRWLFVRQGDLVAQLRMDSQTTPVEARQFAQRVAARLCAGTDAC